MVLVEAMAEVDEAVVEVGVVSPLGRFNSQSRKPAGDLHEVIAQTVPRASTRMIQPPKSGNPGGKSTDAQQASKKANSTCHKCGAKGHYANEGKCVEGKTTAALPKVALLMMRMTDPVSA